MPGWLTYTPTVKTPDRPASGSVAITVTVCCPASAPDGVPDSAPLPDIASLTNPLVTFEWQAVLPSYGFPSYTEYLVEVSQYTVDLALAHGGEHEAVDLPQVLVQGSADPGVLFPDLLLVVGGLVRTGARGLPSLLRTRDFGVGASCGPRPDWL